MRDKLDIFDRPLKTGDEVGGQAWGYTGQIRKMFVRGFTEKKVRVEVVIPSFDYVGFDGKVKHNPERLELTHAYAYELVKTGRNEYE